MEWLWCGDGPAGPPPALITETHKDMSYRLTGLHFGAHREVR